MKAHRFSRIDGAVGARLKTDIHPFIRIFSEIRRQYRITGNVVVLSKQCLTAVEHSIAVCIHKPSVKTVIIVRIAFRHHFFVCQCFQGIAIFRSLFTSVINQSAGPEAAVSNSLYIRRHPVRRG